MFGGDRIQGMMNMLQIQDMPIESNMLSNALDEAQRKVESYFFGARVADFAAACSYAFALKHSVHQRFPVYDV